ncbi:MAG: TIGR02450 family Trp-rich protein [Comamonadaceae bacterium]|nr:TIGR02450 family Trp-rich protein [Comamonadaceae bacterium]
MNPRKLLLSKWTAQAPRNREKHFIVTRVIQPEPPATRIEVVEIEAVISRRSFTLPWRDLTDCHRWLQGWR